MDQQGAQPSRGTGLDETQAHAGDPAATARPAPPRGAEQEPAALDATVAIVPGESAPLFERAPVALDATTAVGPSFVGTDPHATLTLSAGPETADTLRLSPRAPAGDRTARAAGDGLPPPMRYRPVRPLAKGGLGEVLVAV